MWSFSEVWNWALESVLQGVVVLLVAAVIVVGLVVVAMFIIALLRRFWRWLTQPAATQPPAQQAPPQPAKPAGTGAATATAVSTPDGHLTPAGLWLWGFVILLVGSLLVLFTYWIQHWDQEDVATPAVAATTTSTTTSVTPAKTKVQEVKETARRLTRKMNEVQRILGHEFNAVRNSKELSFDLPEYVLVHVPAEIDKWKTDVQGEMVGRSKAFRTFTVNRVHNVRYKVDLSTGRLTDIYISYTGNGIQNDSNMPFCFSKKTVRKDPPVGTSVSETLVKLEQWEQLMDTFLEEVGVGGPLGHGSSPATGLTSPPSSTFSRPPIN